ncbi:hypothetical protein GAY31_19205 [Azospirillum brasilense]|nr:hypothetical protein [Azospirillum brasilense]
MLVKNTIGRCGLPVNVAGDGKCGQNLQKKFSNGAGGDHAQGAVKPTLSKTYGIRRRSIQQAPIVEGGNTSILHPQQRQLSSARSSASLLAQAHILSGPELTSRHLDAVWEALALKDEIALIGIVTARRSNLMRITIDITSEHVEIAHSKGVSLRKYLADQIKRVNQHLARKLGYRPDIVLIMELNPVEKVYGQFDEPEVNKDRPIDLHGCIEVRDQAHVEIIQEAVDRFFRVRAWDRYKGKSAPVHIAEANEKDGGIEGWLTNYCAKRSALDISAYTAGSSRIISSRPIQQAARRLFDEMAGELGVQETLDILERRRLEVEIARLGRRRHRKSVERVIGKEEVEVIVGPTTS